jgi:hypothetical protein
MVLKLREKHMETDIAASKSDIEAAYNEKESISMGL